MIHLQPVILTLLQHDVYIALCTFGHWQLFGWRKNITECYITRAFCAYYCCSPSCTLLQLPCKRLSVRGRRWFGIIICIILRIQGIQKKRRRGGGGCGENKDTYCEGRWDWRGAYIQKRRGRGRGRWQRWPWWEQCASLASCLLCLQFFSQPLRTSTSFAFFVQYCAVYEKLAIR